MERKKKERAEARAKKAKLEQEAELKRIENEYKNIGYYASIIN